MAGILDAKGIPFIRNEDGTVKMNQKQKDLFTAIIDPNIWFVEVEGAKRAGKDVFAGCGFAYLIDIHPNTYHLAIATTEGQAYSLIVDSDGFGLMHHNFKDQCITESEVPGHKTFSFTDSVGRRKHLLLKGGSNKSSYEKFRGFNYGIVYANEANLLHMNTLNEMKDRTMASHLPKIITTQNPGNPSSRFYKEFEKAWQDIGNPKYKNENPNGVWDGEDFRYFHFTQYDNQLFTPERIEKNRRSFSTESERNKNFYGMRVAEEGLVYSMVKQSVNYYRDGALTNDKKFYMEKIIPIDYGVANPQVYLLSYVDDDMNVYIDDIYFHDARETQEDKTDGQYADDFIEFVRSDNNYEYFAIIDPSARSFRNELEMRGIDVMRADNTMMGRTGKTDEQKQDSKDKTPQGIRLVQQGFLLGKIKINYDKCEKMIEEINSYVWCEKSREMGKDYPLKKNDHTLDALRYLINTYVQTIYMWDTTYEIDY